MTVAENDRTRLLAATSDLVRHVDRIRAEVGHGPVLDIVDTNDLVLSNDLAADLRWPASPPADDGGHPDRVAGPTDGLNAYLPPRVTIPSE